MLTLNNPEILCPRDNSKICDARVALIQIREEEKSKPKAPKTLLEKAAVFLCACSIVSAPPGYQLPSAFAKREDQKAEAQAADTSDHLEEQVNDILLVCCGAECIVESSLMLERYQLLRQKVSAMAVLGSKKLMTD